MKLLFWVFGDTAWGDILMYLSIFFVITVLRFFIFKKFFDNFFKERAQKKEEKEEAKFHKLLKEKNMDYFFPDFSDGTSLLFNKHYNNYTPMQIYLLFQKSTGILEMLKVSNLRFPYNGDDIWSGSGEEMERRFEEFFKKLFDLKSLNKDAEVIVKIKKELRPETSKVTFSKIKGLMFKRLEVRIASILKNHLAELKNDNGKCKKEDWKMFFNLSNKLCRIDDPILLEIAEEINKLP